jgi:hypothetical protein
MSTTSSIIFGFNNSKPTRLIEYKKRLDDARVKISMMEKDGACFKKYNTSWFQKIKIGIN